MNRTLREDAESIYTAAIRASLPEAAVESAVKTIPLEGRIHIIAIGKAAWSMASAAAKSLGSTLTDGVVITKYAHSKGEIDRLRIFEAGHPVPDENTVKATKAAVELVKSFDEDDTVLLLVSGGGSALFEMPLIELNELSSITSRLLASGADITEMNTVRKHLSAVKGGRFAQLCAPARVFSVVLSDVLGDSLDVIASGPAYPDSSTSADALRVVEKYGIDLSENAKKALMTETPKTLSNVTTHITGSVRVLCREAAKEAERLGYIAQIVTDNMTSEASDAGREISALVHSNTEPTPCAYIFGGETVVHVRGKGKGGRNQELVLASAEGIAGLENAAIFSVGSDGTDGPTDAAGGYCDGETFSKLGVDYHKYLSDNDAYHALEKTGGLIFTGPTGTNVNDVAVLLLR